MPVQVLIIRSRFQCFLETHDLLFYLLWVGLWLLLTNLEWTLPLKSFVTSIFNIFLIICIEVPTGSSSVFSLILGEGWQKLLENHLRPYVDQTIIIFILKESHMEEEVHQLVLEGMKNPFIAICKTFQSAISCIQKQLRERSQSFDNNDLNDYLSSTSTQDQLKGIFILSKANRKIRDFFMPTILYLVQSEQEQIAFTAACYLGVLFQQKNSKEEPFQKEFIKLLCSQLIRSSKLLNFLFVSLLSRSIKEQKCNKDIRLTFDDINTYASSFTSETLLLFSKFIFKYSHVSKDSYYLQSSISFFLELLPTVTQSEFIYSFFEALQSLAEQLIEQTLVKLKGQQTFKNFLAYNPQCQTQIFQFMLKMSSRECQAAEFITLRLLHILEDNIDIVQSDNTNIMLVLDTLSKITRSKENCVIIFSHKKTLNFLIHTDFLAKVDEILPPCTVFANLLRRIPSAELVQYFQRNQILHRIYGLALGGLLREQQRYRLQGIQIINAIMNFDIISTKDSTNAKLINNLKVIVQQSTFWNDKQEKMVQMMIRAKNACQSLMERLNSNYVPVVNHFNPEIFHRIFKEQRPAAILFHSPHTKNILCQAFKRAAKIWKIDNQKELIFTDIPTVTQDSTIAQFININTNKSPVVVIKGESKYVLSKAPLKITSGDIVLFIGMAQNGYEKQYFFDEQVKYEEATIVL